MKRFLFPLLVATLLFGCASPKFQSITPYPVVTGTGGRSEIHDGVQFWQEGAPKRKYAILGYVDEYWRGPAFDAHDFKMLAPMVKKYGGDAGVVIHGDKPAPGLRRQADEVGENVLRLQVIKYQ